MSRRRILLLILFTIAVTLLSDLVMHRISNYNYPMQNLTGEYELSYNNTPLGTTNPFQMKEFLLFPVYDGDTITITTTLPDLGDLEFPALYFKNRYSAFEIYIDGELYKSYEIEAYQNHSFIGRNNYLISLPADYAGRTMSIKMYLANQYTNQRRNQLLPAARRNAYYYAIHSPTNLTLGNYEDLEQSFTHTYFSEMIYGSSLLFLGVIFLIISVIFSIFVKPLFDHIITAVLFILLGIASHSYYGITFLFGNGSNDTFMLEFAVYLGIPFALILARLLHPPKYKKVHIALEILTMLYSISRILLHYTNIVYMNDYVIFTLIPVILITASIIRGYIAEYKQHRLTSSQTLQYSGLFVCMIFMGGAYIFTGLRMLRIIPNTSTIEHISVQFIADGILFFELANIINYLSIISESINQHTEYDILTRVAYEDVLTKLPNRAMITKRMQELEQNSTNYCIVSLDLNDLKKVNDTYGHDSGDRLLSNFGKILDEVFHRDGMSGRLGGDEFIVLIRNISTEHINSLLALLDKRLAEFSAQDEDEWEYHAAYGYAFRNECEDQHSTYLLADQRMYEHKKQIKK